MPLVPCKCTNCGANLQVDNTKDAAICEFCGSAFIVEKAINNYNVTNHITAGVVNYYGGNQGDFVIRGGVLEKYTGAATDVVIPDTVTSIGAEAFTGLMITSVQIPNSVIRIEDGKNSSFQISGAFFNCRALRKVILPNSVKIIGGNAFRGCTSLTEITIPNSVTEIRQQAFSSTGLTSVTILGVIRMGDFVFYGCSGLNNVTIGKDVVEIGNYSFGHCTGLMDLTIPDNVIRIGNYAFQGCKLKNLRIEGTPELGEACFLSNPSNINVIARSEWISKHRNDFPCKIFQTLRLDGETEKKPENGLTTWLRSLWRGR